MHHATHLTYIFPRNLEEVGEVDEVSEAESVSLRPRRLLSKY